MGVAYRRRHQSYDHRIREAIGFTGNPHLYTTTPIPMSTRRTWASGRIEPVTPGVEGDDHPVPADRLQVRGEHGPGEIHGGGDHGAGR